MKPIKLLSAVEQVAGHLRQELLGGTWTDEMPGVNGLAADLAVNHKTVEAALSILERDGLLAGQGPRRRKRIVATGNKPTKSKLRIAILVADRVDLSSAHMVEIRHRLSEAGNAAFPTRKTMTELGMNC